MKTFISYTLMAIGFYIIAGTAGAADNDPFMPMAQINLQLLLGVSIFANGYLFFEKEC